MEVTVVPYDPIWPDLFKIESKIISKCVGLNLVFMEHIGSTAVPSLASKPVIDILLSVRNLEQLDKSSSLFEIQKYEVMGELGIKGRRYFRKGGDKRTHQIHAFKENDPHLIRHLAFRDYLIAHPKVMSEYADLKTELAQTCNHDIDVYCDGKDPFIKHHEQLALKWYQKTL